MFTRPIKEVVGFLEERARKFGAGCEKVFVAVSGGVDSAVVVAILSRTFGPENVVGLYRDIRSNPQHRKDAKELERVVGFKLVDIDANPMYDTFLKQCQVQFTQIGLDWYDEGTDEARVNGWEGAYASLKSRFATPMAGFIAKAIDNGRGRIFGTGNLEEDILLRYYDKFGDGAVDNNILVGLTKMEVRQLAIWFGEQYEAEIFNCIAQKIPSADLQANGDAHNDENELTSWAKNMGFVIEVSYGSCQQEGTIAWVVKQDLKYGVVTGERKFWQQSQLYSALGYNQEQIDLVFFVRKIEKSTRHKDFKIPGIERQELRDKKFVD